VSIDLTIDWIPDAFMRNAYYNVSHVYTKDFVKLNMNKTCDFVIALNEKAYETNKDFLASNYTFLEKFDVNVIESFAYKFNPENNVRRSPLWIYGCKQ
jgi:hypothetical protein